MSKISAYHQRKIIAELREEARQLFQAAQIIEDRHKDSLGENKMIKPILNWIPDKKDDRDLLYSDQFSEKTKLFQLPPHVDNRANMSPVEDQRSIGSCSAQALVGNLECLELLEMRRLISEPESFTDHAFHDFSRLFIYYNERELEGDVSVDGGARLRDGIKTLAKLGACEENYWLYHEDNLFKKPTPAAYEDALKHKISSYYRLQSLFDMRHCLSQAFPFVFGFTVFSSFMDTDQTGIVYLPKPGEKSEGGHAVLAVGYNDAEKHFIVRNSWGEKWGDHGNFYLPYEYVRKYASDFWSIRK